MLREVTNITIDPTFLIQVSHCLDTAHQLPSSFQTSQSALAMNSLLLVVVSLLLLEPLCTAGLTLKHVNTVSDHKAWKKLVKTRTNVLVLFTNGEKSAQGILPTFEKVAYEIRGQGTLVFIDCQTKDGKKLCKNLKIKPALFELKHYKDGTFHKDYDRLLQEKSLISFMQNPAADPPWSEDPTADSVKHIEGPGDFEKLLRKEKKPILTMFYAPWCGHCKQLKPEFAEAAEELKGEAILAGMDVDTPDAYGIRTALNITGFPTLLYFKNGEKIFDYAGGRDKDGLVEWMRNPKSVEEMPPPEDSEPAWSEVESDVVHLTTETFDQFITDNPSVLVMFYAPWCGHCKAMKPEYTEAASTLKGDAVSGVLAAVDATVESSLAERYGVKGFPSVKYFGGGQLRYEYGYGRTKDDIVEFMMEPKAPPPPEKDWTEVESEVKCIERGRERVYAKSCTYIVHLL